MTLKDVLDIESFGEEKFKENKYIESLSECSDVYDIIKKTSKSLYKEESELVESCANKLKYIEEKQDYKTAALKIAETRDLLEGVESSDENFTHALAALKIKADELCEEYELNPIEMPENVIEDIDFISGIIK